MKHLGKETPFGLRMPPDLKQWVKEKASGNHRSMNSELIVRLEESRRQEEAKQAGASK